MILIEDKDATSRIDFIDLRYFMAEDTPRTQLEAQIEEEKKELEAVPKIPIQQFMGITTRCHLCGQVFPSGTLQPFDTHVPNVRPRFACPNCHPNRNA
jgi:hypothetical protein